jgi:TolB-like protein/Tfp pilus assembly protein PilF
LLFKFEEYVLDPEHREVRRDNAPIHLQPQVFDILEYLIRNRERVVSKDDLISAIWGGRIVSESALTTRINAARTAIGDSGEAQRLILTLPRKGFRFIGAAIEQEKTVVAHSKPNEKPALALPNKPSIAVLPFTNLSGDPEQDYFANGIVEDIITALSRTRSLFVIARNSTLAYKGMAVDIRVIGRELGVRYIVEGSVRRDAGRIRITAQLIEASTGKHIWADRFDRELTSIFAVQDDVTSGIVGALQPQLLAAEAEFHKRALPSSLDAWGLTVRGMIQLMNFTKDDMEAARELATNAIEIAPDYGLAHGVRAFALGYRAYVQWGDDWYRDAVQASSDIKRALMLAEDDENVLFLAGGASFFMSRHRSGVGLLERASALNPNLAMAHGLLGLGYASFDRSDEGLTSAQKAFRLSPRDPMADIFYGAQALCHFVAGNFEAAVASAEHGLRVNAASLENHLYMAAACAELGNPDRAKKQIERALRIAPKMTLTVVGRAVPEGAGWQRYHLALRKAGLPE